MQSQIDYNFLISVLIKRFEFGLGRPEEDGILKRTGIWREREQKKTDPISNFQLNQSS